jgi:hypothetical protein
VKVRLVPSGGQPAEPRKLFGGKVFSNIDWDSIALPTHKDIEAGVASNAAVNIEAVGDPGEDA